MILLCPLATSVGLVTKSEKSSELFKDCAECFLFPLLYKQPWSIFSINMACRIIIITITIAMRRPRCSGCPSPHSWSWERRTFLECPSRVLTELTPIPSKGRFRSVRVTMMDSIPFVLAVRNPDIIISSPLRHNCQREDKRTSVNKRRQRRRRGPISCHSYF